MIEELGAEGQLYIIEPGRIRQYRSWDEED